MTPCEAISFIRDQRAAIATRGLGIDICEPSLGDTCQNSCVGTCQCNSWLSKCDFAHLHGDGVRGITLLPVNAGGGTECWTHFSHQEDTMRTKLKLNVEQLTVDSFKTSPSAAREGTVFACDATAGYTCDDPSCDDMCNTHNPCPTTLFTNCRGYLCA